MNVKETKSNFFTVTNLEDTNHHNLMLQEITLVKPQSSFITSHLEEKLNKGLRCCSL
jgi:hypothetical protein